MSETLQPVTVSVVLPVHPGADPAHLTHALESMAGQTRAPDELVLVEDGTLGPVLRELIDSFSPSFPVERVVLPVAGGLASALNAGLRTARGTWVARMDSDDIALPRRFEAQFELLRTRDVDVVGGAVEEFRDGETIGRRVMPQEHADIARMMRWANPLNHPTVVVRRASVCEVGGYRAIPGLEDYDLWARLLVSGARFHNLPEPLLRFRAGPAMLARRRALPVMRAEVRLQRNLVAYGLIGPSRAALNLILRTGFRLMPSQLAARAHRVLFHRNRC